MTDILLSSGFLLNILLLCLFFPLGLWLMRWQDRRIKGSDGKPLYTKDVWFKKINSNAQATAIFHGLRMVAFAIFIAGIVG